jgi:acyl-CoA synthetase (AMP-forming)/AMP-acid ligase II
MVQFLNGKIGEIVDYENNEEWSAEKIIKEVDKRIAYLLEKNVLPEEKIIIIHGNNIQFFADLLALWSLNACAVCVDPTVGAREFKTIARFCDSRIALYNGKVSKKLSSLLGSLIEFVDLKEISEEYNRGSKIPLNEIDLDRPALILFTSGTTGDPKGVVHSLRTLMAKWEILKKHVPLGYLEISLCLLPTHFGHGLICNCLYPLLNGKKLIILPRFNLKSIMELGRIIDRYKVTYMSSVPAVWKSVSNLSDCPRGKTLQLVTCGSAPLGARLWRDIQRWTSTCRVWNTYGITEVGSWVGGLQQDTVRPISGLIGCGWGADFIITKEGADSIEEIVAEKSLPVGREGHIWINTAAVMLGYYKREDLTCSVMRGKWFYTGDIGYVRKDGLLVLTGRVRNEINFAGLKISPEDIDLVIEEHEAVKESCVFGMNDKITGEIVAVAVVFKDYINKPTIHEMKSWVSNYVSDYKVPRIWYELRNIPKNSRGKYNRKEVAKYCKELGN